MGIFVGLLAYFTFQYFYPEWPRYIHAILAVQFMTLIETSYCQHYLKEIKEKLGI